MNIPNVNRQPLSVTDSLPAVGRSDAQASPRAKGSSSPAAPGSSAASATNGQNAPNDARQFEDQAKMERQQVKELVAKLDERMKAEQRSLSFMVDDELGKTIVKVIDRQTDEVIRQIPSEEFVRFAQVVKSINEQLADSVAISDSSGLLIQEQA